MSSTVAARHGIRCVLIDVSGTLAVGNTPTTRAVEALRRLKETGLAFRVVTNTSKETLHQLLTRLYGMGFDFLTEDDVVSTLRATQSYIKRRQLRCKFVVSDAVKEAFAGVDETDPNAVVVGLAPDKFHYDQLNSCFQVLTKNQGELIAMNRSRFFRGTDGDNCPGSGAFVAGLEFSAGVTATVIGKPSAEFFTEAIAGLPVTTDNTVMIGDDVFDDVGGAQQIGMKGILVKTGKFESNALAQSKVVPWKICDSFADAIDALLAEE